MKTNLKIVGAYCNIQFNDQFDPEDGMTSSVYISIHEFVFDGIALTGEFPALFGMQDHEIFYQATSLAEFAELFTPNGTGDFVVLSIDSFHYVDEKTNWND